MFNQSGNRNQKPKSYKIKQTLQIALVLAVCFWLLFQVKNSYDKSKGYDSDLNVENNVSKEQVSLNLGRKGKAGSTYDIERTLDARSPTEEVEKIEDGGGGDDELDRNAEEKAGAGSSHKEREEPDESLTHHEVDNEKKPGTTHDESQPQGSGEGNTGNQVRDGGEEVEQNKEEKEFIDSSLKENLKNLEEGGVEKERNEQQKEHSEQHIDETAPPPSEIEHTSVTDQEEKVNEDGSFHDVNGAPPDDHELVNSTPNENRSDEQTTSLDQDTESGLHDHTGHGEDIIELVNEFDNSTQVSGTNDLVLQTIDKVIEGEEDKFDKRGNLSEAEAENSTSWGTNSTANEKTAGYESADNIDKSSITDTLETSQESTVVLEDPTSAHSLKMLPEENTDLKSED